MIGRAGVFHFEVYTDLQVDEGVVLDEAGKGPRAAAAVLDIDGVEAGAREQVP